MRYFLKERFMCSPDRLETFLKLSSIWDSFLRLQVSTREDSTRFFAMKLRRLLLTAHNENASAENVQSCTENLTIPQNRCALPLEENNRDLILYVMEILAPEMKFCWIPSLKPCEPRLHAWSLKEASYHWRKMSTVSIFQLGAS